jgi:integrase
MSRSVKLEKRGKNYFARYYDSNRPRGKQRCRRTLKTNRKDVAERRIVAKREAFEKGTWSPWDDTSGPEPMSLSDAISAFLNSKRGTVSDRTLDTYDGILSRWADRCPAGLMLRDVAPKHIKPYVYQATRERGDSAVSQATKRKRWRHLKTFLRWCVKAGHIDANPLDDVPEPDKDKSLPSYLTPDELGRLLEYIDWHEQNVTNGIGIKPDVGWLRDSIIIAVSTGLRRGELLNLRWEDVDTDRGIIHVKNRDGFRTKSGAERTVPVRGRALDTLRRLDGDTFVIVDRKGNRPKANRLSRYFKDMVRAAKLKDRDGLRFHSLRHSCGAWLASQGVSERIIQEILGHASSATTQIYSHVAGSAMEDAMERTFGGT